MSEFDMEKDLVLENLDNETPEAIIEDSEDFGLGEFSSSEPETTEANLGEFASTEAEESIEEVVNEKIASCFQDWSLTPKEMFEMDKAASKKN